MAFASDFNLEELMSEASQIVEASKNGGAPLPDLSDLKATIDGLSKAGELDATSERKRQWNERWNAGESWMVSDDVVTAFCKHVKSGLNDYTGQELRIGRHSPNARDGMFHGVLNGCKHELHVGFCPMTDLAFIGRIAIRLEEAWIEFENTPLTDDQKPKEDSQDWIKRMDARPDMSFF